MRIIAAKRLLKANDQLAAENRAKFTTAGVHCVNIVGSPGAGKTTLLEGLFKVLGEEVKPAVIEGDIASAIDAERIEKLGVPVVQINTDGACHLDANMIAAVLGDLDLAAVNLLFIENIGNLVCTAGFDLGEQSRIVVLSTVEGDDKAMKYPAIFQGSDAMVITKCDLMGHTNFDADRITADYLRLAPKGRVFQVKALAGDGVADVADWLLSDRQRRTGGGRSE